MSDIETLVANIETRMRSLDLNPYSLATGSGLHEDAVRNLLRGKSNNPGVFTLAPIAVTLGCQIEDLLKPLAPRDAATKRLVDARKRAGFKTATQAAKHHGWPPSTYMGHENGSRGLTIETIQQYADAFNVRPEWLAFGVEKTA